MTDLGYCRMCAKIKTYSNLIIINKNEVNDDNDLNKKLSYKILQCFQIEILSDDNLPKTICLDCSQQTNHTYDFYQKVQKAQEFLRNIIFNPTINNSGNTNYENNFTKSDATNIECDNENQNNLKITPKTEITESCSDKNNSNNQVNSRKIIRKSKASVKKTKNIVKAWKSFSWTCYKCQINFKLRNELIKHSEDVHGEPPEYKCPECSKCFIIYASFTRHIQLHENKDKYRCNICGKTFNMNSTLKRHLNIHPELNPQFQEMCTICGKTFKNSRTLGRHAKYYHVDNKVKYECDICNRKLASKSGLNTHKKTHDESTKSYMCDQCGVGFRLKETLSYHIQTIHTEINKDNYLPCSLCPARFKNKVLLHRHICTVHSTKRFECKVCGKKFYYLTSYTQHIRLHTDERPFECQYCKKRFQMKRQLERHIRVHTGEKPYSCTDCNHDFADVSSYVRHMRRKHGVTNFKNVKKNLRTH